MLQWANKVLKSDIVTIIQKEQVGFDNTALLTELKTYKYRIK